MSHRYRPTTSCNARSCALLACLAVLGFLVAGCHQPESPPDDGPSLRIVSLSPAISQTLVDLHADSLVVGRTPYCTSLTEGIPVVGDLYHIDLERLITLEPDLILVQTASDEHLGVLQSLAADQEWQVHNWSLNSLEDIDTFLAQIPQVIQTSDNQSLNDDVASRCASLRSRLDSLRIERRFETKGTVLIVASVDDSVLAFGGGTYLDEALVRTGWNNVVTDDGWQTLSLEDVARLNPDAIVLISDEQPHGLFTPSLTDLSPGFAQLRVNAIQEVNIVIMRHSSILLPSSGLIGAIEVFETGLEQLQHDDTT